MKQAEETSVSWDTALRIWLKEKVFWTGHVDGELELVEDDRTSKMRVIVKGVPKHRVVVLPEKVDHVPGVKDQKGLRRKCDYAMFVEINGWTQIVLIELKLTLHQNDAEGDYKEQLRRTRPIIDYVRSIARLERHGVEAPSVIRYVLICEARRRLDKATVRYQPWRCIEKWTSHGISGVSFVGNCLPFQAVLQKAPQCR